MKSDIPLVCPCDRKSTLQATATGFICSGGGCEHAAPAMEFSIANGIPVLISETRCDTVCVSGANQTYVSRRMSRYAGLKKWLVGESETTRSNCKAFVDALLATSKRPRILVIGSGEKGSSTEYLWGNDKVEIHGVDIYGSPSVDLICDAHYLPLASDCYDGVWIQAVLEHVVEPAVVVGEIFRVLRTNGLVYAETPFMQQVHEGAYDFTRFTVLGHRNLFKKFEAISFGGNKGPELVLAWSVRYLAWSITRSRKIGRVVGLSFGLLMRPFGWLVSKESLFDASSGVYFLGRKSPDHTLTHKALIGLYRGQFK